MPSRSRKAGGNSGWTWSLTSCRIATPPSRARAYAACRWLLRCSHAWPDAARAAQESRAALAISLDAASPRAWCSASRARAPRRPRSHRPSSRCRLAARKGSRPWLRPARCVRGREPGQRLGWQADRALDGGRREAHRAIATAMVSWLPPVKARRQSATSVQTCIGVTTPPVADSGVQRMRRITAALRRHRASGRRPPVVADC